MKKITFCVLVGTCLCGCSASSVGELAYSKGAEASGQSSAVAETSESALASQSESYSNPFTIIVDEDDDRIVTNDFNLEELVELELDSITFQVPENWWENSVLDQDSINGYLLGPNFGTFLAKCEENLDEYRANRESYFENLTDSYNSSDNVSVILEKKEIAANGLNYRIVLIRGYDPSEPEDALETEHVYVESQTSDKVYTFSFIQDANGTMNGLQDFENILNSIREK